MITETHRNYVQEPDIGHLIIDTGSRCTISMGGLGMSGVSHAEQMHGYAELSGWLDRDTARDMGTKLLHWAGTAGADEVGEFITSEGYAVRVYANDGEIGISLNTDGEEDMYIEHELSYRDAVDLGQRLIVWAGVAA